MCEIYKKPTIKIAECRTSILIVLSGTDFTPFCSVLIADFEKKKIEAVDQRYSLKKVVLKISQNRPATLLKRDSGTDVFL